MRVPKIIDKKDQEAISRVCNMVKEYGGVPVVSDKYPDLVEVLTLLPADLTSTLAPIETARKLVSETIDKVGAVFSKLEERGEIVPLSVWETYAILRRFEDKVYGRRISRTFDRRGGVIYD